MNNIHYSSNSSEWETPQALFDELNKEFRFNKDVCASSSNTKCKLYIDKEDDCLAKGTWRLFGEENSRCFMNPPYGRGIGKFIKKAYEESLDGNLIVCLLPARTDTKWFHDYCLKGEIRFLKGRLKFSNAKNSAPFPSMVVIF